MPVATAVANPNTVVLPMCIQYKCLSNGSKRWFTNGIS